MNIKDLELKDYSIEDLLSLRNELIIDLNQYQDLSSRGFEFDLEIIFQTELALLEIDELLNKKLLNKKG
ncbi:hypothetical protein [Helicobacter sp. 11S03491-1]|uniref:hypothetical protein n=1 Tax=Helicobacter sp. 11S03491-1 TaxID=1476196 RepID=UPI000BA53789|nr:hypothetical protein [Helicobacter sp. 11S03491-1]PAF42165.1 hypothetical protein BKH45_04250 [Helicobacter sp. 11S03491-1]